MRTSIITLLASVLWLIIGFWIGKKYTDRKWQRNATETGHMEYGGKIYKVHCDHPSIKPD